MIHLRNIHIRRLLEITVRDKDIIYNFIILFHCFIAASQSRRRRPRPRLYTACIHVGI